MCAWGRGLSEPRLSHDGQLVAFVATVAGRGLLIVVPAAGGPERILTSDPPVRAAPAYGGGAFDWLPDGSGLVVVLRDGGLWRVPLSGGRAEVVVAAAAVTGPIGAPAVAPDGTRVAFVVDQHFVAVQALSGSSWPVLLSTAADFCFDPAWTADGGRVVWHEWDAPDMAWDASRIAMRAADGSGELDIIAGGPGVQVQQPRPSPVEAAAVGLLSDEWGWLNVTIAGSGTPILAESFEHGDPSWGLGQRSFCWSPDGTQVAVNRNEGGFGRLCVIEVATGAVREVAKGVHGGLSWEGGSLAAIRSGARTPTEVVVYDARTWERTVVAHGPVAGFEAADLPEPELVTWAGDDGGEVHGRLYRPRSEVAIDVNGDGRPPPLIAMIHGGPTSQSPVVFNARWAFWLCRGWAVLVPDHRGSTGHGRAYTQAMRGRWGELDVADVAAGLRAAAANRWADPTRMVVMGGSAGGFTVLNVLAHHPELCAAGVDLFGVADLLDLDETTHRFEAHYLDSVVGHLPEAADRYRDRSPVTVADAITAPLLVLQGDADAVVPLAQSESIVERLRKRGRTVELHVYEGEGHGWMRPETVIDELERTEDFLRRHVLRWRP